MIYPFEDVETGEPVEVWMEMGTAPDMGETRMIGGRMLRRLVSMPQVGRIDRPIVSHSLHRWHPDAKAYDEKGRPIINNDAEYRELVKRHNGNENAVHDLVLDD